ncbi:hypothetical protein D3C73_1339520 [compost metagenome]
MGNFIFQRNPITAVAKAELEHVGERKNHVVHIVVRPELRFAINRVQRVIEEVRIHLGGQRFDFRLPLFHFPVRDVLDQSFNFVQHAIKAKSDLGNLIPVMAGIAHVQVVMLHPLHQLLELV